MVMRITSEPLTNDGEWDALAILLSDNNARGPLVNVLKRLRVMGAVHAIVEHDYLDRDFTSEFSHFYAKLFRRYTKVCKRAHFFSANMSAVVAISAASELSAQLDELGKTAYLGFVVTRPVPHAPLGRTVIAAPPNPPGKASKLLIRAKHEAHLLGASLYVEGVPLMQQDTRVGACAQAAIWTVGRHLHSKHRGPWFSVSQITEEASKPADVTTSSTLPAGSGFLSVDNMVRALRAMGTEPFVFVHPQLRDPSKDWTIDPVAAVGRYLDSGLPVILGLASIDGSAVGHAVVAVGHTTKVLPQGANVTGNTRSVFCDSILVNDDQRGAYLRLPLEAPADPATNETHPYNIKDHLKYFLVPLPNKVYLLAEAAETIAWDLVKTFYALEIPKIKADQAFDLGTSAASSDAFLAALTGNRLLARTYLTWGWKYRQRMVRNICSENLKEAVISHDLPRYVWVTEFGTVDSLNHLDPPQKRIFAHAVIDATSSQFHKNALFFHAPGLIKRWFHRQDGNNSGEFSEQLIRIKDDTPYYPKVRGRIVP